MSSPKNANDLFVQRDYVIFPVGSSSSPAEQLYVMILTGSINIDHQGADLDTGQQATYNVPLADVVLWAIQSTDHPPPREGHVLAFSTRQCAPFATINNIKDLGEAVNVIFAVDYVEPQYTDGRAFIGLSVHVTVRDKDAFLNTISFQVTLYGTIVELHGP